jgi:ubiquinone/menaquinone biosynthesis C-methylase UbiE
MSEEKPKYGWYVKNLILAFNLVGSFGLIAFIIGLMLQEMLGVILSIIGIALMVLFFWPGIGLTVMNIILSKDDSEVRGMDILSKIQSPMVLDIGCGTGRTAIKIAKSLPKGSHLNGIDIYNVNAISGNSLATVNQNAELEGVNDKTTFQYGTATEIPFEDNKFHIVNLSSVLHEVHGYEDKERAMKEIHRVLKPKGFLLIGEWNRYSWQLILYSGILCIVFQKRKYWDDLIRTHGFKILNYENLGGYGLFTAQN